MASKRNISWVVGFLPTSGTNMPISEVKSCSVSDNTQVIRGSGDGDFYDTAVDIVACNPKLTVETENVQQVATMALGVKGTVTATHLDSKNGVGTGSINYVLSNAFLTDRGNRTGQHRAYGNTTLTYDAVSLDGVTSPLAVTVTP